MRRYTRRIVRHNNGIIPQKEAFAIDGPSKQHFLLNVLYMLVVLALCAGVFWLVLPWFWPFLCGLGLAYLFQHLSAPIVRALRLRGRTVTTLIALLFYAAVILLFWTLTALLTGQMVEMSVWFPSFYREHLLPIADRLGDWLIGVLHTLAPAFAMTVGELFDLVSASTGELVSTLSASLLSFLTTQLKKLPLFLIGFVFMIVTSFYIGMDYSRITGFLIRQIPRRFRALTLDIKDFLVSCLLKILRAYLILMAITFAELSLGLWALGIDGFWKIAGVIALLDILPLIGSGAVLVPWGVYHLIGGATPLGLGLLILYGVLTVVRNLLEPRIIGDQLGLHPVVTLAAMFFGLRVFGFAGIFLAPIAALLLRYLNAIGKLRLYRP
ncbi:MAG: AI-2E family transporter [Oscillospiraceae bacterium]